MHQELEQCNLAFLYHNQRSGRSSYVTELNLKIKHTCKKDKCKLKQDSRVEVPQTKGRMK